MGDLSKNFNRAEFACQCGCGEDTIDYATVELCEAVREHFCQPVTITSGIRCMWHNERVGGSANSLHVLGRAADIVVRGSGILQDRIKLPAQCH